MQIVIKRKLKFENIKLGTVLCLPHNIKALIINIKEIINSREGFIKTCELFNLKRVYSASFYEADFFYPSYISGLEELVLVESGNIAQ